MTRIAGFEAYLKTLRMSPWVGCRKPTRYIYDTEKEPGRILSSQETCATASTLEENEKADIAMYFWKETYTHCIASAHEKLEHSI